MHHLEHFLIQTADLNGTRDWYVEILGMREGPHPDFSFPVVWLYVGEEPVLHLCEGGAGVSDNRKEYLGQQSEATHGSGVVDHVAFRATDLEGTLADLSAKGIEYNTRQVNDQGLFQVFLMDPNGVKVELNFDDAEAAGIDAAVKATELPN